MLLCIHRIWQAGPDLDVNIECKQGARVHKNELK